MSIPVLMYHNVTSNDRTDNKYTLNIHKLEQQLSYLSKSGYTSLLAEEYAQTVESESSISSHNNIVLTFDDSYVNYYTHILPLLKKYNLKAIFFVSTDYIGKGKEYLQWGHLIEMKDSGMSIQAHTHTHRFLDDLSMEEIVIELDKSKSILEGKLGRRVDFFSCPGGRFNDTVKEVAEGLGYKGMFTSEPALSLYVNDGFFVSGRFLVTNNLSENTFIKLLSPDKKYIFIKRISYQSKYILKKLFGNRLYYFLWRKLIK